MPRVPYTRESIARAFEIHRYHGRIRNVYGDVGGLLSIELNNHETVQVRTLREAYLIVLGLASSAQTKQEG